MYKVNLIFIFLFFFKLECANKSIQCRNYHTFTEEQTDILKEVKLEHVSKVYVLRNVWNLKGEKKLIFQGEIKNKRYFFSVFYLYKKDNIDVKHVIITKNTKDIPELLDFNETIKNCQDIIKAEEEKGCKVSVKTTKIQSPAKVVNKKEDEPERVIKRTSN